MATQYKRTQRSERILMDTPAPVKGIHNTHQEVPSGYAKLLVNFNLNKDYTGLVPREGYATKTNTDIVIDDAIEGTMPGSTHFAGQLYLEEVATEDIYIAGVMMSFGKGDALLLAPNATNAVNLSDSTEQRLDLAVWTNVKLTEVEED